jgi:hypothetical protein
LVNIKKEKVMGLDMYLNKKTYVKNWDYMSEDEKHKVIVDGKRSKEIKAERITYIEEEVAYWRKANQIHNWFVQNVQNGNDNCGSYYVSVEELEKLLESCKAVLEDNSKAKELLPSQAGFFFGPTEYDEWYFKDLENTIEMVGGILAEMKENNTFYDFYYESSW